MKLRLLVFVALAVAMLVFQTGYAVAHEPPVQEEGIFSIVLGGNQSEWDNNLLPVQQPGDGWRPATGGLGPWFEYGELTGSPQVAMTDSVNSVERVPRWWNQWWYDGKLRRDRYKIVDIRFRADAVNPNLRAFGTVWLDWSTDLYPQGTGGPPLVDGPPPPDGPWVGRVAAYTFEIEPGFPGINWSATGVRLPIPYNPEWVSIDVRGYNVAITNGWLRHKCVPEPSGILALLGGMLGLGGMIRRRKS